MVAESSYAIANAALIDCLKNNASVFSKREAKLNQSQVFPTLSESYKKLLAGILLQLIHRTVCFCSDWSEYKFFGIGFRTVN